MGNDKKYRKNLKMTEVLKILMIAGFHLNMTTLKSFDDADL